MKAALISLLEQVVVTLKKEGVISDDVSIKLNIEHTRDPSHGDFASNLAMMLAKPAKQKPRDLAEKIVAALPENTDIDKVEIAGPGFINFFMNANTLTTVIPAILDAGEAYGHSTIGRGKRVKLNLFLQIQQALYMLAMVAVRHTVRPLLTYLQQWVMKYTVNIM